MLQGCSDVKMCNKAIFNIKWMLLVFLVFLPNIVLAQIEIKSEYIPKSSYKDIDNKKNGGTGGMKTLQGKIQLPFSIKKDPISNRPIAWAIGMEASYASLENKNLSTNLILSEMLNAQVGLIHFRPISPKWSILSTIGVGLYTSKLRKISFDYMLIQGGVLFIRHTQKNIDWGVGAAINNALGYPMLFPSFYFDWKLTGKYQFKVSFYDDFLASASVDFNDGKYRLSLIGMANGLSSLTEKDSKKVIFVNRYSSVGIKPEVFINKSLSLSMVCGVTVMREVFFQKRTLKALFFEDDVYPHFSTSAYFSMGIKYGF